MQYSTKKLATIVVAFAATFFTACDDSTSASGDDNQSSSSIEIQSSSSSEILSSQDAGSSEQSGEFTKKEEFSYVVYLDEETLMCESETLIFDVSFEFGSLSDVKMIVDDKDIYKGKYRKDKDENGDAFYLIQTDEHGELDYYPGEVLMQTDPFMLYVKTQEDVQKGLKWCKQGVAEALYEEL